MTSSVIDLSGTNESGPDEPQKQVQPEIQRPSVANGNVQPDMATPSVEYLMPHNHLEVGQTLAQTPYPYIDPFYGGIIATYAGQPAIHPHLMGVLQPGMPLPTDAVVEPVYVNAKQYHGILRRRQSRAKAESENKLIKSRKPYLHESRHQHALKRARGNGGRFLNSKSEEDQQQKGGDTGRESYNGVSSDNACLKNQKHAVGCHGDDEKTREVESDKPWSDDESPPSQLEAS